MISSKVETNIANEMSSISMNHCVSMDKVLRHPKDKYSIKIDSYSLEIPKYI